MGWTILNIFLNKIKIRKILALPLLPKDVVEFTWRKLKECPFIMEAVMLKEWKEFVAYMEHEWLQKKEKLWDFNSIGRVRGTNPAEAYHSSLKK